MDKLMMQNGFFEHTEGTKKVSAGLKNTKKKSNDRNPREFINCVKSLPQILENYL